MRRSLAIALVAGVAGILFPISFLRNSYALDREKAVNFARGYASAFGADTSGWQTHVTTEYLSKLQYWKTGEGEYDNTQSPQVTIVVFENRARNRQVRVRLNERGGLLSIFMPANETTAPGGNAAVAGKAFRTIAADTAKWFQPSAQGEQRKDGVFYRWDRPGGAMTWRITALAAGGTLRRATLTPEYTEEFNQQFDRARAPVRYIRTFAGLCLGTLPGMAAIALYLWGSVRKTVDHRSSLTFLLYTAIAAFWAHFAGAYEEQFAGGGNPPWVQLAVIGGALIPATAFFGAGEMQARKAGLRVFDPLRLALRGRLLSREVGESFAAGISIGLVIAAAEGVLRLMGVAQLAPPEQQVLAFSRPALGLLLPWPALMDLCLVAFTYPILERRVRAPRLAMIAQFILGTAIATGISQVRIGAPALLVSALAISLLTLWAYRGYGVLAALTALAVAGVTGSAVELISTLSPSLRASGWRFFAGMGVALGAAMFVALRGRQTAGDAEPAPAENVLSDRERLRGEFSQAHQAQQRMLPGEAPIIEGFACAAVCNAARDVGGDLYDYFRLPDGRHGVCVADVSGKGMPAALYMTLTKGLLRAAAEDTYDLAGIASQLNTHLYTAARRKMFVTAVLAVFDPRTGEVEHARAGHNPIVFRRASGGTSFLQPPGMGLGIGPTRMFNRALKTERLRLEPGDALVFYSDGVTEAMNARNEQYGEERLLAAIQSANGAGAGELRERILAGVAAFVGNTPAHDDMTVLVLAANTPR